MQPDTSAEQVAGAGGTNDSDTSDSIDDLPLWSPRIVHIRAAITDLDTLIIPFVVLKYDPRGSATFVQERCQLFSGQAQGADALREWWNAPLRALPAEQQYFLVAWSAVPGVSKRIVPVAGLTFGIATPGPHYKRWITTQALNFRGEMVAWCEEIDMSGVQEEIIEVAFTEERLIRLKSGQGAEHSSRVA